MYTYVQCDKTKVTYNVMKKTCNDIIKHTVLNHIALQYIT